MIEYVGEVLTHLEAEQRGSGNNTYLFDLDFYYLPDTDCAFTIDAGERGNAARFINHSCSPNAFIMPALINNVDVRMHRLAIVTRKPIGCGKGRMLGIHWDERQCCMTMMLSFMLFLCYFCDQFVSF